MHRPLFPSASALTGALLLLSCPPAGAGEQEPPTTYELNINGESFQVEVDRMSTLRSTEKPDVAYKVALRIAPQQRVELNTVAFEYTWPSKFDDDHARERRTARIRHELGYFILLTDLDGPIVAGSQEKILGILRESVEASQKESGMTLRKADAPHTRKFANLSAHGLALHFTTPQGLEQTSLIYVLTSEKVAVTCVAQYFDANSPLVLEQIKRTLDSLRPLR